MLGNLTTLVLNGDYVPVSMLPLSTWSWRESVHAVFNDRVTVVEEYDTLCHSPSVAFAVPSVVALREYVKRRTHPSISRHNLITLRDKSACCYCGGKFPMHMLTMDHVVPRCHGGKTRWGNLVSSCLICNQKKGGRNPKEAMMPLLWRPWEPSPDELARQDYFLSRRQYHESWKTFLPFIAAW